LYYSVSDVVNPKKLGGGTLLHLTTVTENKDGSQSIVKTDLYKRTFIQALLNKFSFGQIQVYGSGDGSESTGSKPDYSK
jgi:hypothetical protein